jgi:hypothetical protein
MNMAISAKAGGKLHDIMMGHSAWYPQFCVMNIDKKMLPTK